MAAQEGNRWWEVRSSHGRNPKFNNDEDLWDACCQYFQWVEDNPLEEGKIVQGKEGHDIIPLPKMRAMTVQGLSRFIGLSTTAWYEYCKRDDFKDITKKISEILYDQKFSGAAAGLLNPNIIARDLGLKEQTTNEHVGDCEKPIEHKHSLDLGDIKKKVNDITSD